MRRLGLWIICAITTLSCDNVSNDAEVKLLECYREKFVDENFKRADPIKYFEKLENYLIENKYLKGKTKNDYCDFWNDIYDSTNLISLKPFDSINGTNVVTVNSALTRGCLANLVDLQGIQDNQMRMEHKLLQEIDSVGDIGDIGINRKLIEIIDSERFDKLMFRLPTLTHMYLTIEWRDRKKYGRQQKL